MKDIEKISTKKECNEWLKLLFHMVQSGMIDQSYFSILANKYADRRALLPKEENIILRDKQVREFQKQDV